ncbi:probable allantoinase 1 isoform X3 [Vigna radiata var. radiata]|uniref:Probable allantoinase 1 isoform X3 n=1 Tax=Vigna radiata var. radiata TaxID=3916 RepID=A0A1S3TJ23_VIGRR|nr:probable allantoinase 1 isoform X3 [Vigna radiata var. radiata]
MAHLEEGNIITPSPIIRTQFLPLVIFPLFRQTLYDSSAASFFGASASVSKPDGRGLKHKFNSASGNFSRNSSKFLSNQTSSLARVSEGPRGNDGRKQDLTHASVSGSSFLNLASPAVHRAGLSVLAKYKRPIVVHFELVQDDGNDSEHDGNRDPHDYLTYLNTRPPSWEEAAIRQLVGVSKDTGIGGSLEGAHIHIVHLSDSSASLDLIKEAKSRGDSISVETCPHYLAFTSEEIPNGDTSDLGSRV